jgi:hypothetical protein
MTSRNPLEGVSYSTESESLFQLFFARTADAEPEDWNRGEEWTGERKKGRAQGAHPFIPLGRRDQGTISKSKDDSAITMFGYCPIRATSV